MKGIADQQHPPESFVLEPLTHGGHRRLGRPALCLHDDGLGWDTMRHQEATPYGCLTRGITTAHPTGHDDPRRVALSVEVKCVIEAGAEHWRRPPIVLGGTQNNDGIHGPSLILLTYYEHHDEGRGVHNRRGQEEPTEKLAE